MAGPKLAYHVLQQYCHPRTKIAFDMIILNQSLIFLKRIVIRESASNCNRLGSFYLIYMYSRYTVLSLLARLLVGTYVCCATVGQTMVCLLMS